MYRGVDRWCVDRGAYGQGCVDRESVWAGDVDRVRVWTGDVHSPHPRDSIHYVHGQYASYWNVFLSILCRLNYNKIFKEIKLGYILLH